MKNHHFKYEIHHFTCGNIAPESTFHCTCAPCMMVWISTVIEVEAPTVTVSPGLHGASQQATQKSCDATRPRMSQKITKEVRKRPRKANIRPKSGQKGSKRGPKEVQKRPNSRCKGALKLPNSPARHQRNPRDLLSGRQQAAQYQRQSASSHRTIHRHTYRCSRSSAGPPEAIAFPSTCYRQRTNLRDSGRRCRRRCSTCTRRRSCDMIRAGVREVPADEKLLQVTK